MTQDTIILGIGGYTSESAACLMKNGEILGAVEEERLTRKKFQGGWPAQSIRYLLKIHGIELKQINHISFCYDPWLRLSRRIPYRMAKLPFHPRISASILKHEINFVFGFWKKLRELKLQTGAKIHCIRHHLLHAASAYYSSPFDESAFYTLDQRGEWGTTLFGFARENQIRILGQTSYPHSLGIFYAGLTTHLGFADGDEYKVMGLAAYGKPVLADQLKKVIFPTSLGKFKMDLSYLRYHITRGFTGGSYFTQKFIDKFGPQRKRDEPLTEFHQNLAASVQKVFEDCALHQLRHLHELTRCPNVSLAGGCALNGVMAGQITKQTPFRHVFVPMASGDDGLGLGGTQYVWHVILQNKKTSALRHADLGTCYTHDDIVMALNNSGLKFSRSENITRATAKLIALGKIVGWFQGKMELGARALGFRSILGHPGIAAMKDKINSAIKFREGFRPFAPAVLEEEACDYFDMTDPVPFMTVVCRVKNQVQEKIPAVTHVDGTARVQTVSRESSPLFWQLIADFHKITGLPMVINTSFNVMGEPIVENPQQAIACFKNSALDALAIGDCLVLKSDN